MEETFSSRHHMRIRSYHICKEVGILSTMYRNIIKSLPVATHTFTFETLIGCLPSIYSTSNVLTRPDIVILISLPVIVQKWAYIPILVWDIRKQNKTTLLGLLEKASSFLRMRYRRRHRMWHLYCRNHLCLLPWNSH